jgi:hypothetical protein
MTITPARLTAGDRLGEGRRPGKRRRHIADGARRVKGVSATAGKHWSGGKMGGLAKLDGSSAFDRS